ncbi:MAG: SRPBCC family protein [Gammaproteobacteria bacterium]|nr:SRPBCC family protein [Gammaproteobacteria bacterium]
MKWIVGLGVGLVVLVGVVVGIGMLLPEKHRANESARFRVGAEQLWEIITNFGAYPTWRSGVSGVQRLPDMNGHPVWKETDSHNEGISYETVEAVPGKRLVRRIADPNLPFGGTWAFDLEATPEGVTLTITEDGEVYNPIFRFVSRFIIGHTKNIHGYLNDLQTKVAGKAQ